MKVIFLDHLGVMCHIENYNSKKNYNQLPDLKSIENHKDFIDFNLESVEVINDILRITDANIVISSDWKRWASIDKMKKFYLSQMIIKEPIDYTPFFLKTKQSENFKIDKDIIVQFQRAMEIKEWLKMHPQVTSWVAIDDLFLGYLKEKEWGLENFVWIHNSSEGLTQKEAKENILKFLL